MAPPSRTVFSISLLGAFSVTQEGARVTGFESDKARALLAYLAVEAEWPHRRDKLAGLLWPEWPDRDARANLRHVLNNLRTILGDRDRIPPFLAADRKTIQVARSDRCWLDVDIVQSAHALLRAGTVEVLQPRTVKSLEEAVAAYQGPFLDGFFLEDCVAYEEWLLMTRERLQNAMYAIFQALAWHRERYGQNDEALVYTRRMLTLAPLHEDAHRRLMRLLALSGQRTAALIQFEACRRLLVEELGVEPGQETTALHRRIQRGELTPESIEPILTTASDAASNQLPHHNLPASTTSLVGREQEIAEIASLLCSEHARLVTLTGPGGVGKTRLALEAARDLLVEFDGGVHFVPLATLRDPDQLISAIARVLKVRESSSRTLERAVQVALSKRHCLLLLDNFEHILPVAPAVTDLLSAAPGLTVLVTSRTRLSLYGEHVVAVEPLSILTGDGASTPSGTILHSDAVELFARRARWVNPRFTLDPETLRSVDAVCRLLDGLPLAIELAAARANRLPPAQLLDRLTDTETASLTVLADGPRDAPQRHWSVRDTVRWSYELLDPPDQALFRRLAVFVGGVSVPAAEAVCGDVANGTLDVEDRLWFLAENHLLRRQGHDGSDPRFMLLETVRQFGWECLRSCGELDQTRRAHGDFFVAMAEIIDPELGRLHDMAMVDRLELEVDNLRAALLWAIESHSVEIALRMTGALWDFWYVRSHYAEGYGWLVRALQLAGDQPPSLAYARTLHGAGFLSRMLGKAREALELFEEARRVSELLSDRPALGDSLVQLANTYQILGDSGKALHCRELGLALFRELQLPWDASMVLSAIGNGAMIQGKLEEADIFLQEGSALAEPLNDPFPRACFLLNFANLSHLREEWRRARQLYDECRKLCRDEGFEGIYATATRNLSVLEIETSHLGEARSLLLESLIIMDRLGNKYYLALGLEVATYLLAVRGDVADALVLDSAVRALHDSMGTVSTSLYRERVIEAITETRRALGQVEADVAYAKGQAMTTEETIAFARESLSRRR